MLRVVPSESAAAAKSYFDDGLSREDYYCGTKGATKEPGEPSRWGGKGAERLGLSGAVQRDAFHRLCDNRLPDDSGKLTPRTKAKRRVGYDFNFHVPKSDSIRFLIAHDEQILDFFKVALSRTMKSVEADVETRVRQGRANENRTTGNLVWAEFIHTTTRPINGVPDPLLHAHCYVFNATFDEVERRWKAGEFGRIKAMTSFYEAVFHSIFTRLLVERGYRIRPEGRFYELEGVSRATIEKFSRRSAEINRVAAERGITDPKEKAELGAKTRRSKSESHSWSAIQADWQARLTPDERASLAAAKSGETPARDPNAAREAVNAAIAKCFGKASTVKEHKFLGEALRHAVGRASLDEIRAEVAKADLLHREVGGESYITTKPAQSEEQRIVAFARDGRGTCPPLNRTLVGFDGSGLTAAQRSAAEHALTSRDRVTLIRIGNGPACETLRRATVAGIESGDFAVTVLTADAGTNVNPTATSTVAAFLENAIAKGEGRPAVLWIENASRLPVSTLARLFAAVEQSKARLILCGDLARKSTQRVDILATLEQKAGLRSAQIQEYRRKQSEQRTAIEAFKSGRTHDGFERLDALGGIRESKAVEIPEAVAAEYAKATREGKSAWVVSDIDPAALTAAIRFAIRRILGLSRPIYRLDAVKGKNLADPASYERGQIVLFYHRVKGFKPGRHYKVMGHDAHGNVLARRGLWVEALPLANADCFRLYRTSTIELARGDRIRITSTGRTMNETFGMEKLLSKRQQAIRRANYRMFGKKTPDRRYRVPRDTSHRITGFTLAGDIKLDNGWVLPKEFGHLDYAYASSTPPPRGRSIKRLLIVQCNDRPDADIASKGLGPLGPSVEHVTLFTDNRERLRAAMEQADKSSPHEPTTGRAYPTIGRELAAVKSRTRKEPCLER
jgi:conjugative relaxase-like TrwC/TraI family protein